jgi:hypothetical protein
MEKKIMEQPYGIAWKVRSLRGFFNFLVFSLLQIKRDIFEVVWGQYCHIILARFSKQLDYKLLGDFRAITQGVLETSGSGEY